MKLADFNLWLDNYLNFEKKPEKNIFWLDTMKFLCATFNHPEQKIKCIHVAGSKGKGSTAKMIACILKEHGFKTGIYTSPHILDFRERISSADGFFDDEIYSKSADQIVEKISAMKLSDFPGERPLTWFELVTLFAMLCFVNAQCDFVVYEVGLGGRLDATNVVLPEVSCISRIELEHTEFLGNTVELIAAEKGGIIKEKVPVVISSQEESVKEVFRKIAAEKNAPLYFTDEISNIKSSLKGKKEKVSLLSKEFSRKLKFSLKMPGSFQAENAALACLAVKKAVPQITEKEIESGLEKAFLPARFEITEKVKKFTKIKALVFDGAHTVKSVNFTMETFNSVFKQKKYTRHLLFACAADKYAEDIAKVFKNQFDFITLTKPGCIKQSDLPRLEKAFKSENIPFKIDSDYKNAIKTSLENANEKKAVLLVTGSFYLVSEVEKILCD